MRVVSGVNPDATSAQQFRSQVGHISRHSGIFFAGTIFTLSLGYGFKIYVARALGAENLGIYALGMTLVGLIGVFNTLGLPQSAVLFVAAYRAAGRFTELHSLLWRGAGLLVLANIVLAAVLLTIGRTVAIRVYHAPALVPYLPLFAFLMLSGVLSLFYGKVLAGYRDLKLRTIINNFVGTPLNMVIAIVLIAMGAGLRGFLLAQILSGAIVCALLLLTVRRFTPAEARLFSQPGSTPKKEVWAFSASMLAIGCLEFTMSHVDKIALGFFRTARDVGIYSVAAALVVYVPLVLSSVNQIFAPTIADLHTRGEHALLGRLFQSLTKWVIGLTLPLAAVMIVFSRPLMRIFGPDFEAGWPILVIGTIGQLINCGVGSVGYLLLMSGNQKRLMKVQVTMTVAMLALSGALVPLWGMVGAAVAAAITNVGTNLWNMFEVRSVLGISPYNRGYYRLIFPLIAMLMVALGLKMNADRFHYEWLAIGVALISAYAVFGLVALMFGLDADDRMIASAIRARLQGRLGSVPLADAK